MIKISFETTYRKWNWKSPNWFDTVFIIILIGTLIYLIFK